MLLYARLLSVKKIEPYNRFKGQMKIKSLQLIVALSFLFSLVIFFSSCSVNKAKIDNSLKKYFDSAKVDGCFSLFNNATGAVTVYNLTLDTQRFLPTTTFEIMN